MPAKTPTKSKKPKARAAARRKVVAKAPPARAREASSRTLARRPASVPRALPILDDDDDVLMAHGAGGGAGYGRCGGQAGVAHSHSPRHFEVSLQEKQVAAYAPMIVLRGRGREGKSVVVEASDNHGDPMLAKIVAFRRQYGQEYYVIFVASDDVLEEVELATYDEACAATDINTLISRLAE
jgi:hypothetical protein